MCYELQLLVQQIVYSELTLKEMIHVCHYTVHLSLNQSRYESLGGAF